MFAEPVEPQFIAPDSRPTLIFPLPVVFPRPAFQPTLTFLLPVVLHPPDTLPMKVLPVASVDLVPALVPRNVLWHPFKNIPVPSPIIMLGPQSAQQPALQPMAILPPKVVL